VADLLRIQSNTSPTSMNEKSYAQDGSLLSKEIPRQIVLQTKNLVLPGAETITCRQYFNKHAANEKGLQLHCICI